MSILLILVDGLGLGEREPKINPLARANLLWLKLFQGEELPSLPFLEVAVTDATLGLPGLPQSATGQVSILTGINAPLLVGRHINGLCTPELADLLDGHSILSHAMMYGLRVAFANAYTPPFFEGKTRGRSVTTVASEKAGLTFRNLKDLERGEAVYQDFTNEILIEKGYNLPRLEPEEAGRRLARIASSYDFTLYEYFQTDLAGHSQDMDRAVNILEKLEAFLDSILKQMDLNEDLLVLASDHGNIEDLSTKGHTRNPVPTLLWGKGARELAPEIQAITDIGSGLRRLFNQGKREEQK